MKRIVVVVVLLLVVVGGGLAGLSLVPAPMPEVPEVDWAAQRKGPVDSRSVFWVGHSLMNGRDNRIEGSKNAMEMVEMFAESSSLAYSGFDHTHYGASFSMLWNGRPHSFYWDLSKMAKQRKEIEDNGAKYDALVMTEGIPVHRTMNKIEYTAFYAQKFYCTLIAQNPSADVYVFEAWNSFQAGDRQSDYGPHHRWDWRQRLADDRKHNERIGDLAMTGDVPAPGLVPRLERLVTGSDGQGCEGGKPIFLVPVGTVMGALYDRLEEMKPEARWTMPDGRRFTIAHLFQNPLDEWPEDWPLPPDQPDPPNPDETLQSLKPMYDDVEADDIHAGQPGVYLVALTHYAVLYRRSPVGLPTVDQVPPGLARYLQELVWEVVANDPRTGVAPT